MKNVLRSIGLALVLGALAPGLSACGGSSADAGDEQDQTAAAGKFETFAGEDGQYYFQLLAGNGERVLRSEAYTTKANAKKGIASVRKNGQTQSNFEVLAAKNGESYFNLVSADNGQIIGTSETYSSKSNATRAVKTITKILSNATDGSAKTGSPAFETFAGQDGQQYFRLRAKNGEIVLQSQGYSSASAAKGGIASVQENGTSADAYQVLEAQNDQFYFRLVAQNGKVIARGETYASQSNAERGAETVQRIVREMAGSTATDAQVKSAIEKGAKGATYVSESDYPFTYVSASLGSSDGEITEELVRAKLASFVDKDPDADKPMADLYAMSGSWTEWKSGWVDCPEDQSPGPDDCSLLRAMDAALDANLTGIEVFYFGANGEPGNVEGIAVTILIVGRTPSGNLAGVRAIAIWT